MNTPAINSADSLADAATAIRAMRLAVEFALLDLDSLPGADHPILYDLIQKSRAASLAIASLRRELDVKRATRKLEPTP